VSTSNFVFKRDVIDDVGLFSSYRYVQDYEYLLRLLRRHPEGLEMLDNPLLCYRLHDANTILEDRVGPALQTLQILSRHATPLLVGPNSVQRQLGYEEHLLRLAEYIEHGSAEKANARWVNRIETMQKCIDDLDLYSKRISEHNASLQLFCDRQQVELEKAHAHGEELQRWGEGLQAHADTLQAENTSLHAHVDNLQRWGDDLQAYSSAVEANNHGLQTTVEDCLQWGNELQAFCDKALIDNQGLQDHIETLQKWGDDLSAYCEALQDENRRLHIRVKELQH
jgi:chromosome segregation ATPase